MADTDQEQQVTEGTETPAVETPAVETPAQEVKAGVNDLEKALWFIEQGVQNLGVAAKDELVALAKKYL